MTSDADEEPMTPQSRRGLRAGETGETTELPVRRKLPTDEQPTAVLGAPSAPDSRPATVPTAPAGTDEPAFRQERRVAWVPVALAVTGIVLAIALAVGVTLLAIRGTPPPVAAPSPTTTSSSTPTAAPAAPAPVVAAPRREPGPNECVDALGDGGSVDLDSVGLSLGKGALTATFQLVGKLPDGASSLGIFAESSDGRRSYQLAATWKDGKVDTVFVHDFSQDRDTKLGDKSVKVHDTTVTATFPDDYVNSLGNGWRWYAFSTAGGKVVDACPGDPLSFDVLTFDPGAGGSGSSGNNGGNND
jgi:hypothetical protein